jgi:hypothetical protein
MTAQGVSPIQEHGSRRVLIAFDADPAGDKGAKNLAAELASVGVESYRVELPRDSDMNEVAVAAKLPAETPRQVPTQSRLDGRTREAGTAQGTEPEPLVPAAPEPPAVDPAPDPEPVPEPVPAPVGEPEPQRSPAAVIEPGLDSPAHVVEPVEPTPEEPAEDSQGAVVGRELVIELGTRRWRVRGLDKVTSFDVLRVNLLVTRTDRPRLADAPPGFYVHTLDPYSARARAVFVAAAAQELRLELEVGQGGPGPRVAGVRGEGGGVDRDRAGSGEACACHERRGLAEAGVGDAVGLA